MSESAKKQTFLHGTALLAMATAIVKVIGALYKIPLNAIIGPQGFSYYMSAYEIYTVLLMISTAGLPVAMSRMISEAGALGSYRQMRKIYSVCRAIFLGMGLAGSLLMTVFCKQLAAFLEQPDAWIAIACLGPSCFLICLMSTYRGFFQGQGNMLPTSISQVMEAVCKLVAGMAAALLLLHFTQSIPHAAGGAILGVTFSCLLSSVYLGHRFRKAYRELPDSGESVSSGKAVAKALLAIAVPITIGSAGMQILNILQTRIYMSQLLGTIGVTQDQADTMKGIYNMTQTIFNMPCAFITPITISVLPAITAQLTRGDHRAVKATEESAVRITGLIAAPCALGLFLLSEPVTALLGGYSGENLVLSSRLMSVLGLCVFFNSIMLVTTAIMQAHGHATTPVINLFIGGIVAVATVYMLTGNPNIGIVGAPMGTLLCNICVTILNLFSMGKVIQNPPRVVRNVLRSLLAAVVMGAAAYGTWQGLIALLGRDMSRVIACGVPILVGVVVYVVAAVKLKAITREDCLLLPKGEKIAKMLHL
ncbi:MAG: oligosaccharide flippase family protein [Faecousia sp.]